MFDPRKGQEYFSSSAPSGRFGGSVDAGALVPGLSTVGKGRNISRRHPHQVGSVDAGALVPGLKRPDCEADRSN